MRRLEELKIRRREQKEKLRTWLRLKGAMSHLDELSGAEQGGMQEELRSDVSSRPKKSTSLGGTLGGQLKSIRAVAGRQYGELNFDAAHSVGSAEGVEAASTSLDANFRSGVLDVSQAATAAAEKAKEPEAEGSAAAGAPLPQRKMDLKRSGGRKKGAALNLTAGATRWAVVAEMQRPDLGSIEMKFLKEEIRQLKRSHRGTRTLTRRAPPHREHDACASLTAGR